MGDLAVRDNGNFIIDLYPYAGSDEFCGSHCREIPVRGIVIANGVRGHDEEFLDETSLETYLDCVYATGMAKRQRLVY